MSELEFGSTVNEPGEIVQDYVQMKKLKTQFVNDYPGYDWTTQDNSLLAFVQALLSTAIFPQRLSFFTPLSLNLGLQFASKCISNTLFDCQNIACTSFV